MTHSVVSIFLLFHGGLEHRVVDVVLERTITGEALDGLRGLRNVEEELLGLKPHRGECGMVRCLEGSTGS